MSPRRGLGLNQHSASVVSQNLQDDARARLCTIRHAFTDLSLYLYQADLYAHHHLPDDWYAGAQAMLDELRETVKRHCEESCS